MLDDSSSFLDDLESELNDESPSPFFDDSEPEPKPAARPTRHRSGGKRLFGMTGAQRMVLSMLFFGVVCMLSTGFLLVAGKISF